MTKKEFEKLVDKFGFDFAMVKYHMWSSPTQHIASLAEIKRIAIQAIAIGNINLAFDILKVITNPPMGDSGYYYYSFEHEDDLSMCVPLTQISEVEKLLGFEKEEK